MEGRSNPIDDTRWHEVRIINTYCLHLAYLSLAVKGIGFLVVLWTTVVLLGGFVSTLETKDFWCLTIVTLVRIIGSYDVATKEKVKGIEQPLFGWLALMLSTVLKEVENKKKQGEGEMKSEQSSRRRGPTNSRLLCLALVEMLLLLLTVIVLFPLAVLFDLGMVITAGLSVWRLVQRDFGKDGGPGTNLWYALILLYSLALFQGALCYYTAYSRLSMHRLVAAVSSNEYTFKEVAPDSLRKYIDATRIVCGKDMSFSDGRNLVTYAVELMDPMSSSIDFLSGARILDKLLKNDELSGQHALIKLLVCSVSHTTTPVLHKLLQVLDRHPVSYAGLTAEAAAEARRCAARIVAHLAGDIRLEQLPRGIHSVASLLLLPQLETTMEPEPEDRPSGSAEYKEDLMVQGLTILEKLAAAEHICQAIGNAPGLLSKVMAPVSSDTLHCIDHGVLHTVVEGSLKVMCRLVAASGETGIKLRSAIASDKKAVGSMHKIFSCEDCRQQIPTGAILANKILTKLSPSDDELNNDDVRQQFTNLLAKMFTDQRKEMSSNRKLAAAELTVLSAESKSSATRIFKASDNIVHHLSSTVLDVEDQTCRIFAAEILEHLCKYYPGTMDGDLNKNCSFKKDFLKNWETAMKSVMSKVLGEAFSCGLTGKEEQTPTIWHKIIARYLSQPGWKKISEIMASTKETKDKLLKFHKLLKFPPSGTDLEEGQANSTNTSSCQPDNKQPMNSKLQIALLSLGGAILDTMVSEHQDLLELLNTISPGETILSFSGKLKEMVERNSEPKDICFSVVKFAAKMATSIVIHKSSYSEEELESLEALVISLSNASKKMLGLEGLMIIASADHGAEKSQRKTLNSLVEEALELLKKRKEGEVPVV